MIAERVGLGKLGAAFRGDWANDRQAGTASKISPSIL